MASTLRFELPVRPEAEEGSSGVQWSHVYALAADLNGFLDWGRQKNYVGFSHDTELLMKLRNLGVGGHLEVLKSTDGSRVLAVTDTGLTTPLQITSTLATGTPPFAVASTTKVANLNVDLLDDRDTGTGVGNVAFYNGNNRVVDSELVAGRVPGTAVGNVAFYDSFGRVVDSQLLDGRDSSEFLLLTGGTVTGSLTVLGSTVLGDAAADTLTVNATSTFTGAAGFSSTVNVVGALSVQGAFSTDSSTTLGNAAGDPITITGTATFAQTPLFSAQVDVQGGTGGQVRAGGVIVNQAAFDSTEKLLVNGTSRLKGATAVTTGGFSVVGGATFDVMTVNGTNNVLTLNGTTQTQTTVGGAGGASALPATPTGYIKIQVGANGRLIPFYAP